MTDSNSIARTAGVIALREGIDRGGQVDGHPIEFDPNASWWRDPATIPPRQFLYGRHYIRRAIGATIAAGGRGKTTLAVFEAVTMAAGFDLVTRDPLPRGPCGCGCSMARRSRMNSTAASPPSASATAFPGPISAAGCLSNRCAIGRCGSLPWSRMSPQSTMPWSGR